MQHRTQAGPGRAITQTGPGRAITQAVSVYTNYLGTTFALMFQGEPSYLARYIASIDEH